MRRAVFTMMVGLVSSNALAAWKYVGIDAEHQITTYADPLTITKAGNRVKMWHLFDFKTANTELSKPYRSLKVQSEYDCKQKKSRSLNTSAHKGNMAQGEVVGIESGAEDWRPIPIGSPKEYLFYIACGR